MSCCHPALRNLLAKQSTWYASVLASTPGTDVMIIKPPTERDVPSDPRLRAGVLAERQMAHYLHRAFNRADHPPYILNDIRIVDPEQSEQDGSPGVCQIDHLAIHRWGVFIIESKSIFEKVTVQSDGSGGDEWTRTTQGRKEGFRSPIKQAERQGELLRRFLDRHKTDLLGTVRPGLRTIAKVIHKTDQRSFRCMPVQIIVAFSDSSTVERRRGWTPPKEPFETFVCKADQVPDKIQEQLEIHRQASGLLSKEQGNYGIWSMRMEEARAVADFLLEHHTPRDQSRKTAATVSATSSSTAESDQATPASPRNSTPLQTSAASSSAPSCKSCGGANLTARSGKYGYYWRCGDCGTNTAIPTVCFICGAKGKRGRTVRIRKEGPVHYRVCDSCGMSERIWTQPGSS